MFTVLKAGPPGPVDKLDTQQAGEAVVSSEESVHNIVPSLSTVKNPEPHTVRVQTFVDNGSVARTPSLI
jgi:hypothetical protein